MKIGANYLQRKSEFALASTPRLHPLPRPGKQPNHAHHKPAKSQLCPGQQGHPSKHHSRSLSYPLKRSHDSHQGWLEAPEWGGGSPGTWAGFYLTPVVVCERDWEKWWAEGLRRVGQTARDCQPEQAAPVVWGSCSRREREKTCSLSLLSSQEPPVGPALPTEASSIFAAAGRSRSRSRAASLTTHFATHSVII